MVRIPILTCKSWLTMHSFKIVSTSRPAPSTRPSLRDTLDASRSRDPPSRHASTDSETSVPTPSHSTSTAVRQTWHSASTSDSEAVFSESSASEMSECDDDGSEDDLSDHTDVDPRTASPHDHDSPNDEDDDDTQAYDYELDVGSMPLPRRGRANDRRASLTMSEPPLVSEGSVGSSSPGTVTSEPATISAVLSPPQLSALCVDLDYDADAASLTSGTDHLPLYRSSLSPIKSEVTTISSASLVERCARCASRVSLGCSIDR